MTTDEVETYEASPATTSEWSKSPETAAALLMFRLKGKYKNSDQLSPIVALPDLHYAGRLQCFAV